MVRFRSTATIMVSIWLVALSSSINSAGQVTYKSYTNARFAYSISYPNLLVPQGESTNGDGQKFRSRGGRAELIVYGGYNALEKTLKDIYDDEVSPTSHPKRVVTYKVLHSDWFVVSGRDGGKIFYQKTMLKGDTFKTFRFEYDETQRAIFDPMTTRIEKSFKG